MKDNDILENIRDLYDVKAPSVREKLDFSAVEIVPPPEKSTTKRYISAAVVYAAACLVVLISLPFIIGGRSDEPKPQPGNAVTNTETVTEEEPVERNEDVIDEFMAALERAVADGRITGEYDKKDCIEVTTPSLLADTGARLFKFADTYHAFIYADGEVYEARNSTDSPGTSGAVAWDYDGNGRCDILMSVPRTETGGVERTNFYVFNMDEKAIVTSRSVVQYWVAVTRIVDDTGMSKYPVRDVTYNVDLDNKLIPMPEAGDKIYGYMEYKDGEIVLVKYGENDEVYPAPEVNIDDSVPEEYHEVLIRYRSAVEAIVTGNIIDIDGSMGSPYEPVHAFTAGMYEAGSAMKEPAAEKYGYSLKDMNGDGTPELMLITENHVLLELYTVIDGKAEMLDSFSPRYRGLVLTTNRFYTHGSGGAAYNHYTVSKYDGAGNFVPYLEFGSDVSDDEQYYYKIEDGGEREIITEKSFLSLCDRYPEIPLFGGEDNSMTYGIEFYAISPTIKDRFMWALERGIAEGRIKDRKYDKKELRIIYPAEDTEEDMYVFMFASSRSSFVYSDGEAYPISTSVPVYMSEVIQPCDIDGNGKDDLLIYGTWGSGVAGFNLFYFDSNTKTMTELFSSAFHSVRVVEETDENGKMKYSIYTGFYRSSDEGIYIGTLEYENGKIVTNLIREGTLSEVAKEVVWESQKD